jgi:hypothetical protein
MLDPKAQPEAQKKRNGTALLAVMGENRSSCGGSPLRELHRPVENCINLLYEETPAGELDDGVERSKYFYEPKALDPVQGVFVTNAVEKRRLEEKQLELYETER